MGASARRLKILLIEDRTISKSDKDELGTDAIELYEITYKATSRTHRCLTDWNHMLALVQELSDPGMERDIDVPDMALIDCHFEEDKASPSLKEGAIDPRGLLYGLALMSFFIGKYPGRPFGFDVYSQDLSRAASDPYAQTFYSLLRALSRAIDRPLGVTPNTFAIEMGETPPGIEPKDKVRSVLKIYRNSLKNSFIQHSDLVPSDNGASFNKCIEAIQCFLKDKAEIPSDLYLEWYNGRGVTDRVLLRSLFSDCLNEDGSWSIELINDGNVLQFLDQIATNEIDFQNILLEPVKSILEKLEASDDLNKSTGSNEEEGDEIAWPRGVLGYKQKVLAFLILWAKDRCNKNWERADNGNASAIYANGTTLLTKLKQSDKEINRAITNGELGIPCATQKQLTVLLDSTNSWPFDSTQMQKIKDLIEKYLDEICDPDNPSNFKYCRQLFRPKFLART